MILMTQSSFCVQKCFDHFNKIANERKAVMKGIVATRHFSWSDRTSVFCFLSSLPLLPPATPRYCLGPSGPVVSLCCKLTLYRRWWLAYPYDGRGCMQKRRFWASWYSILFGTPTRNKPKKNVFEFRFNLPRYFKKFPVSTNSNFLQ